MSNTVVKDAEVLQIIQNVFQDQNRVITDNLQYTWGRWRYKLPLALLKTGFGDVIIALQDNIVTFVFLLPINWSLKTYDDVFSYNTFEIKIVSTKRSMLTYDVCFDIPQAENIHKIKFIFPKMGGWDQKAESLVQSLSRTTAG